VTERLADIGARIAGVQQLGAVVNAMRGIAAARVQQARVQLAAVDSYAATIAMAIGQALALISPDGSEQTGQSGRLALVLFCAEQGFAGAFSERVLDAVGADLATSELFLIGTRGSVAAAERGIAAGWKSATPSHSLGIPKLADRIIKALYARIATGEIDRLDAVFSQWQPGQGNHVKREHSKSWGARRGQARFLDSRGWGRSGGEGGMAGEVGGGASAWCRDGDGSRLHRA
jgi:F-type H+-transporting ATPase subunit gamma